MKYSKTNLPLACYQNQSSWLKGAVQNSVPVGILWHDTAGGNPNICRYVQPDDNATDKDYWLRVLGKNKYANDWNHIEHQAGLNCWIGKLADGTISTVQTGPWTTTPWGCGSGSKGSCNGYIIDSNGNRTYAGKHWVQFEICDDGYESKEYFNQVFEEACQFTAYICSLYNINPKGTVSYNGVTVPTILCHADSYKLKLGGNHGDVYLWFNKFGKTMDDVRNRVVAILAEDSAKPEYYRVRKSWADAKSQIGAYTVYQNAVNACNTAGFGYSVFNEQGKVLYSTPAPKPVEKPKVQTKTGYYSTGSEKDIADIWKFLKTKISNDYAVAGIMGNIFAESGFRSNNLQNTFEKSLNMTDDVYTFSVDDGSYTKDKFITDKAGYGLCQWTYSTRKEAFLKAAIAKNVSIGDLAFQLDFLWQELSVSYNKTVLQPLLAATSVLEASNIVLIRFEAPATKDEEATQQLRCSYSQKYFNMFHVEAPKEELPSTPSVEQPPAVESPSEKPEQQKPVENPENPKQENTTPTDSDIVVDETTKTEVGNLFVQCINAIIKIFKLIFKQHK